MKKESLSSGNAPFRILSLDGGGAKGFYTLGILAEIEAMLGQPLHTRFDLLFGTSTGAIIAALLARGESVATVQKLYEEHVPTIMKRQTRLSERGPFKLRLIPFSRNKRIRCTGYLLADND